MNAGNLQPVAEALKGKFPGHPIIIMADNDRHDNGYNTGIKKAEEAVRRLALQGIVYPEFAQDEEGSDWNDYAAMYGDGAAAILLREEIEYECMSEADKAEHEIMKRLASMAVELDKNRQVEPEDFIAGIFPRKRISAVIAAPGTGKTWFLQRAVSDLSCGGAIFDGFATEEEPLKSVIFAGESGADLMIRRAAATNWAVNQQNVKIYGMLDAEDGKKNIERILKIHKPDIVFFDTFGSFHNSDENKADEMKPILCWLATQ